MLSDLGLPAFVELLDTCRLSFCNQWQISINPIVKHLANVFFVTGLVTGAVQYVCVICIFI